jgi:inorganic pyrophosphatase/exopolyphosphatase
MNLDYLKKYSKIMVIGHKTPDTDTAISSCILCNILNYFGIKANYAVLDGEKLNQSCQKMVNDVISFKPLILKDKDIAKYHYFLVDHNDPLQSIKDKTLIVGVIDHHPNSWSYKKAIFTKYCSTTLAIYDLFKDIYPFSDEEKQAIYMGLVDDSSFGRNSRYKDIDRDLVSKMGLNPDVSIYFDKYFIPTNNNNIAFENNGHKSYDFNGIKFDSTYIERLDTNGLNDYKEFISKHNHNFLGLWIDYKDLKTYTFLKYKNKFIEKNYDYVAARSTTVLNDMLEYIRSLNEKENK